MRTLMLGIALLGTGLAAAQQVTVTARLMVHQTGVPQNTLQTAQQEAVDVVRTAGIMLHWIESGSPDFLFTVKDCDCGATPSTLGQTMVGDPHRSIYSFIYFNRVLSAAHKTELSPGHLLGDVIAHELGHLLGLKDRREGIMTSKWGDRELALLARRRLGFTEAEVKKMNEEIRVRRMLQDQESHLLALAAHKRPLP